MSQGHIIVQIDKTSRPAGRGGQWARYGSELAHFNTVREALAWIKGQYDGRTRPVGPRRVPVYVDTKSRGTIQTGWIYSGKEGDSDGTTYLQDWVSLNRVLKEYREGQKGELESVDVKAAAI